MGESHGGKVSTREKKTFETVLGTLQSGPDPSRCNSGPHYSNKLNNMKTTISADGYADVFCDAPLPCPFCGCHPKLCQLAHVTRTERIGRGRKTRTVRVSIVASTSRLTADTFWFKCPECSCTSGAHHDTAQKAAESWNRRANQGNHSSNDTSGGVAR